MGWGRGLGGWWEESIWGTLRGRRLQVGVSNSNIKAYFVFMLWGGPRFCNTLLVWFLCSRQVRTTTLLRRLGLGGVTWTGEARQLWTWLNMFIPFRRGWEQNLSDEVLLTESMVSLDIFFHLCVGPYLMSADQLGGTGVINVIQENVVMCTTYIQVKRGSEGY